MYIVIEKKTITIPGDERSRTHPGHGYPESTEIVDVVTQLTDENQLKYFLERKKNFAGEVFKAEPVKVKFKMEVQID